MSERRRLYEVLLDPVSLPRLGSDQDHERAVAIFDLVEDNAFALPGRDDGPFSLTIAQAESRLDFHVRTQDGRAAADFHVSMTPFRPLLKDYFLVCETYYNAIRTASPSEIEAIDRERTALHNEGAALLESRLADKVEMDKSSVRRLFTLVSALHWK